LKYSSPQGCDGRSAKRVTRGLYFCWQGFN
jgi:hypothetical protein